MDAKDRYIIYYNNDRTDITMKKIIGAEMPVGWQDAVLRVVLYCCKYKSDVP